MDGLIVAIVLLVLVIAVAYGLYTRKGSGIEPRPWGGEREAAGAEGREELSGRDEGEGSALEQAGTDATADNDATADQSDEDSRRN